MDFKTEFTATSRLADLFSASCSNTFTVGVLSKQAVTVEVMQLKRSMYDDPEGFILKHFSALCNLLKSFGEYDESLNISALKVLIQVSEKMVSSLSNILEDDSDWDEEYRFKKRNMMKMTVFLLCHFTHAFEKALSKKVMAANIMKEKKKKFTASETSEWPELRVKFIVAIKKLFKLPISKLWDPPAVEPEFVNFVTITFFKLLESPDVAKDKGMRSEIFKFLGTVLTEYRANLVYSVKIVQLVQDFDHLSSVLSDAVVYFVKECSADTLISDICREATLLDTDVLTQNLTAAHSLSQFLISVAGECPERFLPLVSCILQFLERDPHVIRNCALSILGILLTKCLCSATLTKKETKIRTELMEHLEAHLLDANSFVRCRAIQVLKMLMEEKALVSSELYAFGKIITRRLRDKASNVRKNAMSFMAEFVRVNEFACQIPLPVLKESLQTEIEKLKELKKKVPFGFADSEDEENEPPVNEGNKNALIFDDSDDDSEKENEPNRTTSDQNINNNNAKQTAEKNILGSDTNENKTETVQVNGEGQENGLTNSHTEALKKQQMVVDYLKNTYNFSEVIHSIIEPVSCLLHSSTQTDILEAIDFIVAVASNSVKGTESCIKEVLKLVWSKETVIKEAAFNAFRALYLKKGDENSDAADVARNLINLLKSATSEDALNIEEYVKYFYQLKEMPSSVPNVLWTSMSNPSSALTTEEDIAILQLLYMLTKVQPDFILMNLDNFMDVSLRIAENNFLLAMYVFKVLRVINFKTRGKVNDSVLDAETRLPHDHIFVTKLKYFLIEGIQNYEDDQWAPMADEAVAAIFSLIQDPISLCAILTKMLSEKLYMEMQESEKDERDTDDIVLQMLPHVLLSRFLTFCGHVAIHYNTYMKVDYFAYLRRQEAIREKRRRRSSIHATISTLHSTARSPSSISPNVKSSRKKKIFMKKYKVVPPVDEETTYEQIIESCNNDVKNTEKLVGSLYPLIVAACRWTLKMFNKDIQAAASLSLAKVMLLSEQVCEENMQLFATIIEKSPEPSIRATMIIAMGDLATSFPNIVEPWTHQIFQRLKDTDSLVRENAIIILAHLILHDFVRIKSLISEVAKCIADENQSISTVSKFLFAELSKKGNIIYNIVPDIISSLSDPNSSVEEEKFQTILRYILQFIEKEKLVEGLVEKLCCRFTDSSTEVQMHELTFCLSILNLNDKCFTKLMEFKNLLKERMSDPIVLKYITNITANAKKNDAKTAAELEAFRNELGI